MAQPAVPGLVSSILIVFLSAGCPGTLPRVADGAAAEFVLGIIDSGADQPAGDLPSATDQGVTDAGVTGDQSQTQPDIKPAPDLFPQSDLYYFPKLDLGGASDVGKTCQTYNDCIFKICATMLPSGLKFCSKICNPCNLPCPGGSGCKKTSSGSNYICVPGVPSDPCVPDAGL